MLSGSWISGDLEYMIAKQLKLLKEYLEKWNKEELGNIAFEMACIKETDEESEEGIYRGVRVA